METKRCKQCGDLKPIEQFRKYYGGRKGTYNTCKACEKINARAKYLRRKDAESHDGLSSIEVIEIEKINKLYELQRAAGLQPPNSDLGRSKPIADSLDDMIAKYKDMSTLASVDAGAHKQPVPAEIQMWMTEALTEEPEYYLDEIYEDLKAKYRPQLCIDTATMQPVYDDTYKEALDQVLTRFYEYEETYWDKED